MKLHIPKPCHEDWSKMNPGEKGRFCASCTKEVYDLTSLSDEEVVRKVVVPDMEVCGRISTGQLRRINAGGMLKKAAMLALISSTGLVFMTGEAAAQEGMSIHVKNEVKAERIKVSGIVTLSDSGQALAGIRVMIDINGGERYTADTDENGTFEIELPVSRQAVIGLVVLSPDPDIYETLHMKNLPWNDQHLDIRIEKKVEDNKGEIADIDVLPIDSFQEYSELMVVGNLRYDMSRAEAKQKFIEGFVMNEAGEPVFEANVLLYDRDSITIQTQTDENGYYRIMVPEGTSFKARLFIRDWGYEPVELEQVVSKKQRSFYKETILRDRILMGDIGN